MQCILGNVSVTGPCDRFYENMTDQDRVVSVAAISNSITGEAAAIRELDVSAAVVREIPVPVDQETAFTVTVTPGRRLDIVQAETDAMRVFLWLHDD